MAVDTNVLLHFVSFTDANWSGIVGESNITLYIPETVIRELDEKKFEGATATIRQRAQDAISRIEKNLDKGPMPNGAILRLCPQIAESDWSRLALDPANPDHRIVADILALKASTSREKGFLVTGDLALKLTAMRLGVAVIAPPTEWRRELKDPKEKELEAARRELSLLRERLPNVGIRFAAGKNTIDRLQVDIASQSKSVITDDAIRKSLAEKRGSKTVNTSVAGLLSSTMFGAPPEAIARYERDFDGFVAEYERHLRLLQSAQRKRASMVEARFVMRNTGAGVAQDIDVWLVFPPEVEVVTEDPLSQVPDEPSEPTPPRTVLEASPTAFPGFSLSVPLLPSRLEAASEPPLRGPEINPDAPQEVRFWIRQLKHSMMVDLPPLFLQFRKGLAKSFGIKYTILVANHPEPSEGTLSVVVVEGQE